MRTRRRAPEQADFQRYKKERMALFTSLLEPREDLDASAGRHHACAFLPSPHPLGGIMFVHEDVTDKLALESSYNTLIAVQRETLDNLAEGIAVFGPDGKLRLFNPAFARIWKLPPEFLASQSAYRRFAGADEAAVRFRRRTGAISRTRWSNTRSTAIRARAAWNAPINR